jgi:hypothetical protein
MRLATAASYFDDTPCRDGVTPASVLFRGQLNLYDDSQRDGPTVVRRVLSVAPSIAIPSHRLLEIHGERWIVGASQLDSFGGEAIRNKYILLRAQGACTVKTAAQALSSGGSSSYATALWMKDWKEENVSSALEAFFNVYLPSPVTIDVGQIVTIAGRLYRARNSYPSAGGFTVAECDGLASDAIASGTYQSTTYNPATDTHSTSNAAVSVLKLRWQEAHRYAAESAEKFEAGDIVGLVTKVAVAAAKAGHKLTIGSTVYAVHAVGEEGACWALHLRKAAA